MGSAGHIVMVKGDDGATRPLPPRNDLRNHSPDGFSWGYGGSGPAQLALAILVYEYGELSPHPEHYQQFKADVIATMEDKRNFTLTSKDIQKWRNQRATAEAIETWPKGARVRYVPAHANGDPNHKACESGCIKRVRDQDAAFVLYDVKGGQFKMVTGDEPFTAAGTRFDDLVKLDDAPDILEETRKLYRYLTNDDPDPDLTIEQLYDTIKTYDA